MSSINIWNEVHIRTNLEVLKSFGDHQRAEIRATNSDVDNIFYAVSGVAFPLAGYYLFTELLHMLQNSVDIWHHVLSVDMYGPVGAIAKGNMQNRTIFSEIDWLSREHCISELFDIARTGLKAINKARNIKLPIQTAHWERARRTDSSNSQLECRLLESPKPRGTSQTGLDRN